MSKILNLDKLVAAEASQRRVLKINGVDYPINEMSVQDFIQANLDAERLEKEGTSVADQVKAAVDMIARRVPDVPRDILVKYSMPVLRQIMAFVRGDDVEEAEEQAKAEVEDGAAAGN